MLGTMNSIGDYYNQMAALRRVSQQLFGQPAVSHGSQIVPTTTAECSSSYQQVKSEMLDASSPDTNASVSATLDPSAVSVRDSATPPALSVPPLSTHPHLPSSSSSVIILSQPELSRPQQVFICTIQGSLRHGQQIHLVTTNGQIYTTTVAQLTQSSDDGILADSLVRRQSSSSGQGLSPTLFSEKQDGVITLDQDKSDRTPLRMDAEERTCEDLIREKQEKQRQMLHLPKGRLSCNGDLADDNQNIDGLNLEEIKEFAKSFKLKRLSMGLTQTQVGQALSLTEGPAYSQSAICRFEKLDITPKSAQKIKPVLEKWMTEIDEKMLSGHIAPGLNGQCALPPCMLPPMLGTAVSAAAMAAATAAVGGPPVSTPLSSMISIPSISMPVFDSQSILGLEIGKKRKRRTSFTPQALEVLNRFFERNTHPTGAEMTALAESLNYEREVVRVWFCNKRQALKNTIKKLKHVDMVVARQQHQDVVRQQPQQQQHHVIHLPHQDNH